MKYFTTKIEKEEEWQLLKKIAESCGIKVDTSTYSVKLYTLAYTKLNEVGLCMTGSFVDEQSKKVDFKEFLLYLTGVKTKKEISIVTDKFDVVVNEEGIDFGCQFIEKEDVGKIFEAWREVNE